MTEKYTKYESKKRLQEAYDNNEAIHISAAQAAELRRWSNEEISAKARELRTNRREKRKGSKTKVAILLAATALGVGVVAKATQPLHASPNYKGERMYQVQPGDNLEQILEENVKGINSVDIRAVEYDVKHDPDNADVFNNANGEIINPGDIIEIPKKIVN